MQIQVISYAYNYSLVLKSQTQVIKVILGCLGINMNIKFLRGLSHLNYILYLFWTNTS